MVKHHCVFDQPKRQPDHKPSIDDQTAALIKCNGRCEPQIGIDCVTWQRLQIGMERDQSSDCKPGWHWHLHTPSTVLCSVVKWLWTPPSPALSRLLLSSLQAAVLLEQERQQEMAKIGGPRIMPPVGPGRGTLHAVEVLFHFVSRYIKKKINKIG